MFGEIDIINSTRIEIDIINSTRIYNHHQLELLQSCELICSTPGSLFFVHPTTTSEDSDPESWVHVHSPEQWYVAYTLENKRWNPISTDT